MAQTVIGLFDNTTAANTAVQALLNNGFPKENIDVSARSGGDENRSTTDNYYTGTATTTGEGLTDSISDFFSSLFDDGTTANNYSEVARHSNAIVTVHAQTAELAAESARILDENGAIDVDERLAQGRQSGSTANSLTENQTTGDISIPVIEEQLQVGKREVETGGVRLRSRVIEKPVEESLRLREERVFVERRPVDRAATEADLNAVSTGNIELTERSEVAVVGKEARVVEEISVGKEVGERTETIRDTVRKTDVEVEEFTDDNDKQTRSANK